MIFEASEDPLDITLLVYPDASLMSLAATLDPMRAANRVAGRRIYRWRIVSMDGTPPATTCGLSIPVDGRFEPARRRDVLMRAHAVGLVDAGDTIVGHERYFPLIIWESESTPIRSRRVSRRISLRAPGANSSP